MDDPKSSFQGSAKSYNRFFVSSFIILKTLENLIGKLNLQISHRYLQAIQAPHHRYFQSMSILRSENDNQESSLLLHSITLSIQLEEGYF